MTGGRLAHICRHPIKGHGRETLASVRLLAGACLPWDRHWAVAHEAARLTDGWNPCMNFARGAKAPALMAITCQLDEATRTVTLHHPERGSLTFRPDAVEDLPRVPTLVLTHGGAMRAALAHLCGFSVQQSWSFGLPYAALLSLERWTGEPPLARITGLRP